jgi:hypothetical protein
MRVIDVITLQEELEIRPGTILGTDGKPTTWHVFDTDSKTSIQSFTGKDAEGRAEEFRDAERAKRSPKPPKPAAPIRPRSERDSGKRADAIRNRRAQLKDIRKWINKVDQIAIRLGSFGELTKNSKKYLRGRITASSLGLLRWLGIYALAMQYIDDRAALVACRDLKEDSVVYDEIHLTTEEYEYAVTMLNAEYVITITTSQAFASIITALLTRINVVSGVLRVGGVAVGTISFGMGTAITWALSIAGQAAVIALLNSDKGKAAIAYLLIYVMTPDDEQVSIAPTYLGKIGNLLKSLAPSSWVESWRQVPGQRPGDRDADGKLKNIGANLTDEALASRIKAVQLKITTADSQSEKDHWNDILTKLRAEQIRRKTQVSIQPEADTDTEKTSNVPGDSKRPSSNANMPDRDHKQQTQDVQNQLKQLPNL